MEMLLTDSADATAPDYKAVQKELERTFRTRIPDDDPVWMTICGVYLMARENWGVSVEIVSSQLDSKLAEFNQSLDIAMKSRQQEGHANIQKMLTVAQCQLKLTGSEIESQLRSETADLVSAAKDLRGVNRSMRWFDWFIGAVFMALVLAVGIVVGYLWRM